MNLALAGFRRIVDRRTNSFGGNTVAVRRGVPAPPRALPSRAGRRRSLRHLAARAKAGIERPARREAREGEVRVTAIRARAHGRRAPRGDDVPCRVDDNTVRGIRESRGRRDPAGAERRIEGPIRQVPDNRERAPRRAGSDDAARSIDRDCEGITNRTGHLATGPERLVEGPVRLIAGEREARRSVAHVPPTKTILPEASRACPSRSRSRSRRTSSSPARRSRTRGQACHPAGSPPAQSPPGRLEAQRSRQRRCPRMARSQRRSRRRSVHVPPGPDLAVVAEGLVENAVRPVASDGDTWRPRHGPSGDDSARGANCHGIERATVARTEVRRHLSAVTERRVEPSIGPIPREREVVVPISGDDDPPLMIDCHGVRIREAPLDSRRAPLRRRRRSPRAGPQPSPEQGGSRELASAGHRPDAEHRWPPEVVGRRSRPPSDHVARWSGGRNRVRTP